MLFTIIALLSRDKDIIFSDLQKYLYKNDFRYQNSEPSWVMHVTLAKWEIEENWISNLALQFKKDVNKFWIINIDKSEFRIFSKEHDRVKKDVELLKKFPEGCSRITLLINNIKLIELSNICRKILISLEVDRTWEYINNIKKHSRNAISSQWIADHMNICNYARLDKTDEAMQLINEKISGIDAIALDRLAIYSQDNIILDQITLN